MYPSTGYSTPPWNELVIYELHIGSFVFDPASAHKRESFASAIGKLDYLRDLGINAIEVMALAEFDGDISWGYNPAYIFAIEDEYGGPDGFRNFVIEAHNRGIAVIIDVVYNTSAIRPMTCGGSTAGRKTERVGSIFTTTGEAPQPGARRASITDLVALWEVKEESGSSGLLRQ